jgi:hypothetical protein
MSQEGMMAKRIVVMCALAALAVGCGDAKKLARKSKTSEPAVNVKKLYNGARAYLEEETYTLRTPLPRQFPASTPITPPLGACCQGSNHKCAPDPTLWTDPTWEALGFSMDDPHYFSYKFESSGTDLSATFTATAYGDLDCDGVYSTFEMVGSIQPDGTVTGSAGVFKDHELE